MKEIIDELIRHIQAHNKKLPTSYLQEIDSSILVYEAHPLYREYFEKLLKQKSKNESI